MRENKKKNSNSISNQKLYHYRLKFKIIGGDESQMLNLSLPSLSRSEITVRRPRRALFPHFSPLSQPIVHKTRRRRSAREVKHKNALRIRNSSSELNYSETRIQFLHAMQPFLATSAEREKKKQ